MSKHLFVTLLKFLCSCSKLENWRAHAGSEAMPHGGSLGRVPSFESGAMPLGGRLGRIPSSGRFASFPFFRTWGIFLLPSSFLWGIAFFLSFIRGASFTFLQVPRGAWHSFPSFLRGAFHSITLSAYSVHSHISCFNTPPSSAS